MAENTLTRFESSCVFKSGAQELQVRLEKIDALLAHGNLKETVKEMQATLVLLKKDYQ